MRRFATAVFAAFTMIVGLVGQAAASPTGTAVISSTLTGPVAVAYGTSTVTGDLTIAVDQAERVDGMTIEKLGLELPEKIRFASIGSIALAGDAGDTCSGSPLIAPYVGKYEFKVTAMGCADTNANGIVEFTLSLTGISAVNRYTVARAYAVKSEFKSNPYLILGKWKYYEWENRNPSGAVITVS